MARGGGRHGFIKTFDFSICVPQTEHPDACKNAGSDARVVVSDDAMDNLDRRIGQAASTVGLPNKGEPTLAGQDRHQHHRRNQDSQLPGL